MKRILTIALGALAVSAACFTVRAAIPHNDPDWALPFLDLLTLDDGKPRCRAERNDQTIVTRNFAWDGDDSVTIRMAGIVRYRRGVGQDVSIRARTWVLDHVRVANGRIEFDCRNMNNVGKVEITLPGVPFRSFALTGAGKMVLDDIQQDELKIATSGAASVKANGKADDASISIAGLGKVDVGKLATRRIGVSIAGSGDVDVAPQDSANITIAGAGRVKLLTEPKELSTHIAGAGRVVHGSK
jgi:hypothetical protein